MPAISLPPATTAIPASTAATAAGGGSTPGESTAGPAAIPFATLLMKRMAVGLELRPGLAALPGEASAEPAAERPDGDATLLPDLLALMDAASEDSQGLAAESLDAAAMPVAIAAPVASVQLPQPTLIVGEVGTDGEPTGSKGPAATAILAASPGVDGKKLAADAETRRGFELSAAATTPQEHSAALRGEAVLTPIPAQLATATRLEAPVGTQQWNGEIANKVTWMVTRNEQRADLVLNPPSLGRIEVSVSVNGDNATAVFTSINPAVREALEGAMPRLREALLEAGINLGQTQVGSESPQQSPERDKSGDNSGSALAAADIESDAPGANASTPTNFRGARSLVDVFA